MLSRISPFRPISVSNRNSCDGNIDLKWVRVNVTVTLEGNMINPTMFPGEIKREHCPEMG